MGLGVEPRLTAEAPVLRRVPFFVELAEITAADIAATFAAAD
ncbi:hypothetical protein ACFXK0_17190 [Nocardia sp. NPDC059177]